ncbi:translation initiation factor IF-2-like [Neovison vison]|uniref:translation initiation factor IF-2-like n=1 Tax=Neovison vison TaxID=452646 RepID=UPI001CF03F19|nr:translation initiation factor IF-2-like [Neogale vison]
MVKTTLLEHGQASPPPAGPAGEELGASPPRGGARSGGAGRGRTRRGGPGTRGGAGLHTGRSGWLRPLRSRRRLEEEARRLEEEGRRRRPRLERRLPQTHFPGSAGKGTARPLPVPGPSAPSPPAFARAGRGCGRHGRVKGPERPRGLRRPGVEAASAAIGREGWGVRQPAGVSRRAVGAAPPSLASGEAVVRRGAVIPGRGAALARPAYGGGGQAGPPELRAPGERPGRPAGALAQVEEVGCGGSSSDPGEVAGMVHGGGPVDSDEGAPEALAEDAR